MIYALPCIAGHVGAGRRRRRAVGGSYLKDELTLLVDVGTNAEIVLGNRARMLACSSPTGRPSRARRSPAASARRPAPSSACASTARRWSRVSRSSAATCGRRAGLCRGDGRHGRHRHLRLRHHRDHREMYLSGVINQDGVVDGALRERTPRVEATGRTFSYVVREGEPRIAVTQNDVRAIQLAKAALYAGIKLLMDRYGVDRVERITWPAPSAAISTCPTRWRSASCRIATRQGRLRRKCRRDGRANRAAQPEVARRDRIDRPSDREDRDGAGARIPGAFRRRHGHPQQAGPLPRTRQGSRPALPKAASQDDGGRRRRRREG